MENYKVTIKGQADGLFNEPETLEFYTLEDATRAFNSLIAAYKLATNKAGAVIELFMASGRRVNGFKVE